MQHKRIPVEKTESKALGEPCEVDWNRQGVLCVSQKNLGASGKGEAESEVKPSDSVLQGGLTELVGNVSQRRQYFQVPGQLAPGIRGKNFLSLSPP